MNLTTYYQSLSAAEKREFATKIGTSLGYLRNIIGGFRPISPELAVEIERVTGGKVPVRESLPHFADQLRRAGYAPQASRAA